MYATRAALMYDTLSVARPAVLVIHDDGHDDGEALEVRARRFEAPGLEVTAALAGVCARAHLEGERLIQRLA